MVVVPKTSELDMQGLLDAEDRGFHALRRGEVVDGVIVRVDPERVLVDIGAKTEGVVAAHEMRTLGEGGIRQLNVGDPIVVYVVQVENEEGQAVLSLDRASGERGWRLLEQLFEKGDILEAQVVDANKGGLIVALEGVRGFVPNSQVVSFRSMPGGEGEDMQVALSQFIGKQLRFKIIEINRKRNRLILSERVALQEWRNLQKERLLTELKEGDIRPGRVSGIRDFGVFIDLGGADGLVPISEMSWDRTRAPQELLKLGDEVEVYVMKVDPESKKIGLSLRRAKAGLWDALVDKYQVDQLVTATITKLVTFGAFARIESQVEGLIHISEIADRRIGHPKEVLNEGDMAVVKIVRIERDRHRLALSLRQAQQELGEDAVWVKRAEATGGAIQEVQPAAWTEENIGIAAVPQEQQAQGGLMAAPPEPSEPEQF